MSGSEQHGRRVRLPAFTSAVLLVAGVGTLLVGVQAQVHPPQPAAAALVPPSAAAAAGPAGPSAAAPPVTPLAASEPWHLDIPAIGVSSYLVKLGLQSDGTVQVPPLSEYSRAGWYRRSATPGALGTAVLLGHVDSAKDGPAVFFRLGALRAGDLVTVTRVDRSAAVFRIDRVVAYPKANFPTQEVYGNTDHAELRLITCGGQFDEHTGNYLTNIVAYASLVHGNPAGAKMRTPAIPPAAARDRPS